MSELEIQYMYILFTCGFDVHSLVFLHIVISTNIEGLF